ncbi:MAG: phosphoribosylformylglycinamidine cyclo-ligase [Myxococcales bacterium]|nr:phosphoribosylformylglycinamidine cyclo-ligase [Myxococcales bacterium]
MASLTYRDAGVDIHKADAFIEKIRANVQSTHGPEVLGGLGGFGAAFLPDIAGMEEPTLISGTDGVGTKLMLAQELEQHNTVGIDLVAMCVNDILTLGARPLFFLDYLATGKLDPQVMADVVAGITEGCRQAGAALVGGETAELPDMYEPDCYDLAGFSVGLVDKKKICDGQRLEQGDVFIGLPASGVHSNGFSLVRHVLRETNTSLQTPFGPEGQTIGSALLEPTTIYVRPVLELAKQVDVRAMAHITGGGIGGNLVRVLPEGLRAQLDIDAIPSLPIFEWLLANGVDTAEAFHVFNMGVGFILAVPAAEADTALSILHNHGQDAFRLGTIEAGEREVRLGS